MRGRLYKTLRWLLVVLATVLAAVVLGTVVPRPLFAPAVSGEQTTRHILVLASPIHTDIAVPIDPQTLVDFAFLRDAGLPVDHPDARWMLFGWGSRAYYMATPNLSDTSFGPLFKALTLDASVMHAEILGPLDETHPAVSSFEVSDAGLQRMLAFIRASFAETNGAPVHIDGAHYGASDGFFEAVGSFNALIGCNTWTAAALRQAGLRTGWWNPLPETLAFSLALHN
jgi:uncharacterized protein (TIGR02117 family)